ncbi:MAG: tRNA (adenosine(37)-N6)-dimethylallyltransferase MiaA [Gammaproteobacteria bacterium]|nr:tRNA (adenosine(37)-N6)-dimethylallyltransferase MiaA [Gammaproteobacteria bacterium]
MQNDHPPIVCLMGPTASGKTPLAIEMIQHFPCEIISVDSAMIYRTMDIGTAKPTPEVLKKAPHRLIDILDPSENYSAGQFLRDVTFHIQAIQSSGKIPLLVGGTMLYFRVLQQGIAQLPHADGATRDSLQAMIAAHGIEKLHQELAQHDPESASRIARHDTQRIQRALEVFYLTGQPLSLLHKLNPPTLPPYQFYNLIINPENRSTLHERIEQRLKNMVDNGFLNEVKMLFARQDLSATMPSIRSVGYRQAWSYLANEITYDAMVDQILAATRQLAKRQLTWLRKWPDARWFTHDDEVLNAMERIKFKLRNTPS